MEGKNKKLLAVFIFMVFVMQYIFIAYSDPYGAQMQNHSGFKSKQKMLVKYKNDKKGDVNEFLNRRLNRSEIRSIRKLTEDNKVEQLDLDEDEVNALKTSEDVEMIEMDSVVKSTYNATGSTVKGLTILPSVISTKYDLSKDTISWNLERICAPLAIQEGGDGKDVKVAIFDTGIDKDCSDIKVAGGVSYVDGDSSYTDDNGHGTAMASILGALNNNIGLMGVAPKSKIYSVKVLNSAGDGTYSGIISGIDWSIKNKINVISMSFGGTEYSKILEDKINEAYAQNIMIIAASGNEGSNQINFPARYKNVISVGALDKTDAIASFSNYGPELDIVAPGVDVDAYVLNNKIAKISGTSPATPHVAGVVAEIFSKKNDLTVEQIKAILLKSAVIPLMASEHFGWGVVNGYNSVQNINANLTISDNEDITTKFLGLDSGTQGKISYTKVYSGDGQTIYCGKSASVVAEFSLAHSGTPPTGGCRVTCEQPLGNVIYQQDYSNIYGNGARLTYNTPNLTLYGNWYVRYHCFDNQTDDSLFTIYVVAGASSITNSGSPTLATTFEVYANNVQGAYSVQFPTWTTANGQDDIEWFQGVLDSANNRWKATINKTNHKNETGEYVTHVYAYDVGGNAAFLGNTSVVLQNASATSTPTPSPLPALGTIGAPVNGATISGIVNVGGWYLDGSGVSKVEILVDGVSKGLATYGGNREDVYNAYPSYGNHYSGYNFSLDTRTLTNGSHVITPRETSNTGKISTITGNTVTVSNAVATPTPTLKPTNTPTPTLKPTNTPTPTVKPTNTPTPTPTPILSNVEQLYTVTGSSSAVPLAGVGTASERFTAAKSLISIEVQCPCWSPATGTLTLKLYPWRGDYNSSIEVSPIAEQTFINYIDNSFLKLSVPTQPAGDYIWVLSNPVNSAGVWKYAGSTHSATAYLNGGVTTGDFISRVNYTDNSIGNYVVPYNIETDNYTAVEIRGSTTVAEAFYASTFFSAIDVQCPTWSTATAGLTFTLYRWLGDYNSSVSSAPIARKTYTNLVDNAFNKMSFSAQPSGYYIWVLSNPVNSAGVWKAVGGNHQTTSYLNGTKIASTEAYRGNIYYINNSKEADFDVVNIY